MSRDRLVLGGLAAGLLGAVFALACSSSPTGRQSSEPISLTIGVPQSKQNESGHGIDVLASFLTRQRLSASDAAGRPKPLLATWTVADDGLSWRFSLQPNATFHDDSPVTAADVKRWLDAARRDPDAMANTACLDDVADVLVEDDRSFVVHLTRRCSLLLDDLDFSVTKPGADGGAIGTGPFVAEPFEPSSDTITLAANEHYYGGRPGIDRVKIRAFLSLREAWVAMLRGEVDFLWEVGPDAAEFIGEQTSVELRSYLGYAAYTIIFNSARPPFDRPEVKQALSLAIDRAALLQRVLHGRGTAASSPIWPNHWARPAGRPEVPFAPAEAAAGLRKALGRPDTGTGRHPAPVLSFSCLIPEGFTVYERLALLVQQQLQAIDVDMRLEAVPMATFNERLGTGSFDALLLAPLSGANLGVHYRFWHSPSPSRRMNYWGYSSSATDSALEELRNALTDDDVRRAVAGLDAALRADPPGVVLLWSETLQAVSRRFVVPDSGKNRDALHVLWEWRLAGSEARRP